MKVFLEEQKMIKPIVIIGLSLPFIGICYSIFNDWKSFAQSNSEDKIIAISGLVLILLIALLLFSLKLKTRIDDIGIYYRFYPIHFTYRVITWNEIATCYVRNYNAIFEYGGWGFKSSLRRKKGKSFTVKGKIGLQMELKNGKKLLIGTQKKEEIQRVLDNYNAKITN
jgi:hypothetical protein